MSGTGAYGAGADAGTGALNIDDGAPVGAYEGGLDAIEAILFLGLTSHL